MDIDETIKIEEILNDLYRHWESVRHETINSLGKDATLHIIDYHGNNWIDITKWILAEYGQEYINDIIFEQFFRLFKEIIWLQFLLQVGNYNIIYRNLRYILEMMAQAYYIDWKYQDSNLDAKTEKIEEIRGKNISSWKLVQEVLCKVFKCDGKVAHEKYHPIWNHLNEYTHPDGSRLKMIAQVDPSSLYIDSFNESLAKEAIRGIDEIFDLSYILIFEKYPRIKRLALKDNNIGKWEEYSPKCIEFISE